MKKTDTEQVAHNFRIFRTFMKWFWGVLYCFVGLGTLLIDLKLEDAEVLSGNYKAAALFAMLTGIICIPPFLEVIEGDYKWPRALKYVVVIGCMIVSASFMPDSKAPEIVAANRQIKAELKKQLQSQLLLEGPAPGRYTGNSDSLYAELNLFLNWAYWVENGEQSNKENQEMAATMRQRVEVLQVREFPKMRQEFAREYGQRMNQVAGLKVVLEGTNNEILTLSGKELSSESYIQQIQKDLDRSCKLFRIKKTRFLGEKQNVLAEFEMEVAPDSVLKSASNFQ